MTICIAINNGDAIHMYSDGLTSSGIHVTNQDKVKTHRLSDDVVASFAGDSGDIRKFKSFAERFISTHWDGNAQEVFDRMTRAFLAEWPSYHTGEDRPDVAAIFAVNDGTLWSMADQALNVHPVSRPICVIGAGWEFVEGALYATFTDKETELDAGVKKVIEISSSMMTSHNANLTKITIKNDAPPKTEGADAGGTEAVEPELKGA